MWPAPQWVFKYYFHKKNCKTNFKAKIHNQQVLNNNLSSKKPQHLCFARFFFTPLQALETVQWVQVITMKSEQPTQYPPAFQKYSTQSRWCRRSSKRQENTRASTQAGGECGICHPRTCWWTNIWAGETCLKLRCASTATTSIMQTYSNTRTQILSSRSTPFRQNFC